VTRDGAVLFDVGADPAAINQCLAKAGIKHLLAIYISHFHADHAAGLVGAISNRRVDQIFISPNLEPKYQFEHVKLLAAKAGIEPKVLTAGTQIQLAEMTITTLWPLATAVPVNENDASLILLVESQGFKFLFTGDLEPAGQGALMQLVNLDVDVALVPHHGSKFQAEDFAAWTNAEFGIVSVGENRFGHPAAETLQNWQQQAVVLRTDLAGDIAILRSPSGLRAVSR
jgi:competence protein ComEC